jgi:hypothetical protein
MAVVPAGVRPTSVAAGVVSARVSAGQEIAREVEVVEHDWYAGSLSCERFVDGLDDTNHVEADLP